MNFRPPTDWLQRNLPSPSAAAAAEGAAAPFEPLRFRGQVQAPAAPRREALVLPAGLALEAPLPSCKVQLRLRALGEVPVAVEFCLTDFTHNAVALAHLRFADSARRGWLLEEEREAQDMLDAEDPTALHLVGRCKGQILVALRLVLPQDGAPFAWQEQVFGPHAAELAGLAPAGEFSRLALARGMDTPRLLRGLVQAATYVLLACGRRYAFVAAPPGHVELWARFGLTETGLGGYVPSAKPHVVTILLADLLGQYQGRQTNLATWRNLFSGTHDALERALSGARGDAAQVPAPTWSQAVYRSLSKVLTKLNSHPFAG